MENAKLAKNVVNNILAMARGTLVVDECVQELASPLSAQRFRIYPSKGLFGHAFS